MKKPQDFAKKIAKIQKMPLFATDIETLESQTENIILAIKELRDEQETKRNALPLNFHSAPGSGAVLWARYEILDNSIYALEDIDFTYNIKWLEFGGITEQNACDSTRKAIKQIISYQNYLCPPDRPPLFKKSDKGKFNPNIGLG